MRRRVPRYTGAVRMTSRLGRSHGSARNRSRRSVHQLPYPPGALAGIRRYFVLCTQDRAIPPALQRRMIAENGCDEVIELDTDHTPHLSMPNELSRALDHFAIHSSA